MFLHVGARPRAITNRAVTSWSPPQQPIRARWSTDLPAVGEAGVLPYIYVDHLDDTLHTATARGAELVTPPYPEGNLWIATIRDPAGNVIGIWQDGPH
jgi:hypothetical protein